jgi:homoserine kinase
MKSEITIPASTSNLGASFDTCGLALSLYLKLTIEESAGSFEIIARGEGAGAVPCDESNLIARVARFVARRRGRAIEGARIAVDNQIPLARGLGSSSAAVIAGISVYETLSGERLTEEEIFSYALHFEGHGDNLAPGLLGGLVVVCVAGRGDEPSLLTIKRAWPEEVKIALAIPDYEMNTAEMRRALPAEVPLADAVFNVQRAALLQAAISERRFDFFREALRDRLHQPYRAPRGPGLSEVLKLNDEDHPGLLGVAISGAGSTMVAFADDNLDAIAAMMKGRLLGCGVGSRSLQLAVDNRGRTVATG